MIISLNLVTLFLKKRPNKHKTRTWRRPEKTLSETVFTSKQRKKVKSTEIGEVN